jgi:Family of unknown function (DUF6263)
MAVVVVWLLISGALEAQTLLRWKLKPGESFSVHTQQQTESQVAFGAKSAKTKIEDELYLTWVVAAADDEAVTIRQTIQRIVVNMVGRDAAAVQFDSASKARPTGQAVSLASSLKPLVGAEFELKMSARGEMLEVKPVNEAATSLFASDEKPTEAGGASRGSLQQLLRQPLVILSADAVKEGSNWTISNKLATSAGPMVQETAYSLVEISEQGGKSMAKIAARSKLSPEEGNSGKSGSRMTIKDQKQEASIVFSATDGRVIEVEQTQKLETERIYRETTIVVTLNSTQTTTITPNR